MQSSTCSKNMVHKEVSSESAFIFDDSHEFGASNGVFDSYSNAGNFLVELFLIFGKHLSSSFLDRLYDRHFFRAISLISGILIQGTRNRKRIHCVSHLLVMRFPGNGLANKENQTGYSNDNRILHRMTFLFPTVLLFLLIIINRTRNFPFCAIMQQYRLNNAIFRNFRQARGKFFIRLSRHKSHCLKTQLQNMTQTVYKSIAMLLIHTETSGMILLQRVIFQVYKNKEKTIRNSRQGAVTIYAKTATVTTALACQFIFRQIIVMRCLKVGQQMKKLNMGQACQGTEAFRIVFMLVVIHDAKIHAYAIYNKSNLH